MQFGKGKNNHNKWVDVTSIEEGKFQEEEEDLLHVPIIGITGQGTLGRCGGGSLLDEGRKREPAGSV